MRSSLQRVEDMLAQGNHVLSSVAEEQRGAPDLARAALAYRLLVIGEAARYVDETTRRIAPAVPWTDLVGLRNILVHQYWRVEWARVQRTIDRELPRLVRDLELLRAQLKERISDQ